VGSDQPDSSAWAATMDRKRSTSSTLLGLRMTVSWRLLEKPVIEWAHGRRRRTTRLAPAVEAA